MKNEAPITVTTHEQLCIEQVPERPCAFILFGASGDLAYRKLLPSFYNLYDQDLLPKSFFLIGTGRKLWDDDKLRENVREALKKSENADDDKIEKFLECLYYTPGDYADAKHYEQLKKQFSELAKKHGEDPAAIFYLSIPPPIYETVLKNLKASRMLVPDPGETPKSQVVLEKPFAENKQAVASLNENYFRRLHARQVYRIDHYLGKETVQNILMFRFANTIFENVWNREHIESVQITAAETLGIGHRAGYYETAGILLDMFQNHMMELLALVAMEPPLNFDPKHYRNEKVKVLNALRPLPHTGLEKLIVRGQYDAGTVDGKAAKAYRQEQDVPADSQTETFAAMKVFIDNWRWKDVPFYLRSGKRLKQQVTEIVIRFKPIHYSIFSKIAPSFIPANILRIGIQPYEGVKFCFNSKYPGPKMCLATLGMEFNYESLFHEKTLNAYERLILDCMQADSTLFVRQDMVDFSWQYTDMILSRIKEEKLPLHLYPAGSWGPKEANAIFEPKSQIWGDSVGEL